MLDGLSQKDIDSLLKGAMPAAPVTTAAPEVLPYNFLRPPRISRDRRATLEGIYSRFAVAIQPFLASRLRQPTDVIAASVEQATFGEFIMSLGNPCAAFVFDLGHGHAQGVLDLSVDFSYYLVDRMFGGPGEIRPMARALTQLERLTVKGVADRALALLNDVWRDFLPFQFQQTGFESAPEALQVANKEDNVLVANLDVRTGTFNGVLTVCLPLDALEAFLQEKPAAVRQAARVTPEEQVEARRHISAALQVSSLTVRACFPPLTLRARDLAALRVGDVIHTGFPVDTPIEVHVNGRRRFQGVPGQVRRTIGVRLTHLYPSGQPEPAGRARTARVV